MEKSQSRERRGNPMVLSLLTGTGGEQALQLQFLEKGYILKRMEYHRCARCVGKDVRRGWSGAYEDEALQARLGHRGVPKEHGTGVGNALERSRLGTYERQW